MNALRARWVFPVTSLPLRDATVVVHGGRIVGVGDPPGGCPVLDLGCAALLPGLVNAHTHLELSDLATPIGQPGMGMADWVRAVVAHRRAGGAGGNAAIRRGLAECLEHGTTTVGDIVQPDWQSAELAPTPVDGIAFLELIAPVSARVDAVQTLAEAHLRATDASGRWNVGLSPHAPHTVHPSLMRAAISLSAQHRIPLALHLAESAEEMELLRSGGGPLRKLLEEWGVWETGLVQSGSRPLDYLRQLANAHRTLIVHGNYLTGEDTAFLGRHRERMSVVYCPRTHAWFRHPRYPLEAMLAAGVRVALGTDSRASSPDLNLLAEMRWVARQYSQISREAVLQMGTIWGAEALGLSEHTGSLKPGKWANLVTVPLLDRSTDDPYDLLLKSDSAVTGVWWRGARVVGRE